MVYANVASSSLCPIHCWPPNISCAKSIHELKSFIYFVTTPIHPFLTSLSQCRHVRHHFSYTASLSRLPHPYRSLCHLMFRGLLAIWFLCVSIRSNVFAVSHTRLPNIFTSNMPHLFTRVRIIIQIDSNSMRPATFVSIDFRLHTAMYSRCSLNLKTCTCLPSPRTNFGPNTTFLSNTSFSTPSHSKHQALFVPFAWVFSTSPCSPTD